MTVLPSHRHAFDLADARSLRLRIEQVVAQQWPTFARAHPALARVIDQELLRDYAFDSLADDPAFVEAYRQAVSANLALSAIGELVAPFIGRAIARLL